jgi:hypothetical protein
MLQHLQYRDLQVHLTAQKPRVIAVAVMLQALSQPGWASVLVPLTQGGYSVDAERSEVAVPATAGCVSASTCAAATCAAAVAAILIVLLSAPSAAAVAAAAAAATPAATPAA